MKRCVPLLLFSEGQTVTKLYSCPKRAHKIQPAFSAFSIKGLSSYGCRAHLLISTPGCLPASRSWAALTKATSLMRTTLVLGEHEWFAMDSKGYTADLYININQGNGDYKTFNNPCVNIMTALWQYEHHVIGHLSIAVNIIARVYSNNALLVNM